MILKVDTSKVSIWMAAGMGGTIISMFPTAIAWVWTGATAGWKALLTEAIVYGFFFLGHAITDED